MNELNVVVLKRFVMSAQPPDPTTSAAFVSNGDRIPELNAWFAVKSKTQDFDWLNGKNWMLRVAMNDRKWIGD